MTITLSLETEARLCEKATREGLDVNTLADALLAKKLQDDDALKEEVFDQALLAAGLISRVPPPRDPSKAKRPTFKFEGEPLSETIMRERR